MFGYSTGCKSRFRMAGRSHRCHCCCSTSHLPDCCSANSWESSREHKAVAYLSLRCARLQHCPVTESSHSHAPVISKRARVTRRGPVIGACPAQRGQRSDMTSLSDRSKQLRCCESAPRLHPPGQESRASCAPVAPIFVIICVESLPSAWLA